MVLIFYITTEKENPKGGKLGCLSFWNKLKRQVWRIASSHRLDLVRRLFLLRKAEQRDEWGDGKHDHTSRQSAQVREKKRGGGWGGSRWDNLGTEETCHDRCHYRVLRKKTDCVPGEMFRQFASFPHSLSAVDMEAAWGNWEQLSVVSTAVCDKTTALLNSSSYWHVNNWRCLMWIHSGAVEGAVRWLHSRPQLNVTLPQKKKIRPIELVPVKVTKSHTIKEMTTAHGCVLALHLQYAAVET